MIDLYLFPHNSVFCFFFALFPLLDFSLFYCGFCLCVPGRMTAALTLSVSRVRVDYQIWVD